MLLSANLPPIPGVAEGLDARDYHAIAVGMSDPRAAEPLTDIAAHTIAVAPYCHLSDGSPPLGRADRREPPRLWFRRSVVPVLQTVNAHLAAHSCEIVVYDADRSVATQHGLWARALAKVGTDNPDLRGPDLERLASQYSSGPRQFDATDATTWPTHSTGASIDLILRSAANSAFLDLGAAFDELDEVAHTDQMERELSAGRVAPGDPALTHRDPRYHAVTGAGFANYRPGTGATISAISFICRVPEPADGLFSTPGTGTVHRRPDSVSGRRCPAGRSGLA